MDGPLRGLAGVAGVLRFSTVESTSDNPLLFEDTEFELLSEKRQRQTLDVSPHAPIEQAPSLTITLKKPSDGDSIMHKPHPNRKLKRDTTEEDLYEFTQNYEPGSIEHWILTMPCWMYCWILLCCPICCPLLCLWGCLARGVTPRCFLVFTLCLSTVFEWLDEITDIIFLNYIYDHVKVAEHEHRDLIFYLYVGGIVANHLFNVYWCLVVRNVWTHTLATVPHSHGYTYIQHIPNEHRIVALICVGVMNATLFDDICKAYYLLSNTKNQASNIYIDLKYPCKRHNVGLYNKMYDNEAIPIKYGFIRMLEKETELYPYLSLAQTLELVPKLVSIGLMAQFIFNGHWQIILKFIVVLTAFLLQIKSCFVPCENMEYIQQFTLDSNFDA